MDIAKAVENQLKNIEKRVGKSLQELGRHLEDSGKTKHGELVAHLKETLGMGHGDANAVVKHHLSQAAGGPKGEADAVDEMYSGAKAVLRPIHDAVMAQVSRLGEFETAPKKGYVSLRRRKQFAMVGPATNTQIEIGLNMKGATGTDRLKEQAPGGMCSHKVRLGSVDDVDAELTSWLTIAFESAG